MASTRNEYFDQIIYYYFIVISIFNFNVNLVMVTIASQTSLEISGDLSPPFFSQHSTLGLNAEMTHNCSAGGFMSIFVLQEWTETIKLISQWLLHSNEIVAAFSQYDPDWN